MKAVVCETKEDALYLFSEVMREHHLLSVQEEYGSLGLEPWKGDITWITWIPHDPHNLILDFGRLIVGAIIEVKGLFMATVVVNEVHACEDVPVSLITV